MGRFGSMAGVAGACLAVALPGTASALPILSINLFNGDSNGNCADTITGSGCSPLGISLAGSMTNPLLNNTATKQISLEPGSYYLFGNPWAGTAFMTPGDPISLFLRLSVEGSSAGQSILLIGNSKVPDLSLAGTTLFDFPSYGISITTTGITNADRMSFGYPPAAFTGDGRNDFVLQLNYRVAQAVPEPATWAMMIAGFGFIGAATRRRKATAFPV